MINTSFRFSRHERPGLVGGGRPVVTPGGVDHRGGVHVELLPDQILVVSLVIADQPITDTDSWEGPEDPLIELVLRGHQDGSIDSSLSVTWVVTCLWVLMYATRLVFDVGDVSRREVTGMLDKTLATGFRPAA